MSKSVFLLPIVFIILLLAFPLFSVADQVEDIPDNEEQVQTFDESATKTSDDESPSFWKRLFGFGGSTDESSSKTTEQKQMPAAPALKDLPEKAEQAATAERIAAEKAEQERLAAEKAERDRIASERAATAERIAAEKAEQERPAAEKSARDNVAVENTTSKKIATEKAVQKRPDAVETPGDMQKSASAGSSSSWQNFLSMIGLKDNRRTIPPMEVKSSLSNIGQDYIIGPGDLLGISVWRDDSLTKTVVVLPDGKIQFPLIGEISAGGKSVAQLKREFVEKLSSYVVDADISVEVKQSNSLFIYIIGKVNNPGRQMLVADTTILQALAMAGGLNTFAEKDDIRIFRQDRDRTLVFSFRYSQVVSGNNLDDNLLLKRGDVIVVP